jgi:hypothetical protein
VSFSSRDGAKENMQKHPNARPLSSLTCRMHTRYCVTYFSSATACVNTREHISARQCQGHCRGQNRLNPDAAPLHACPPSKTTHGVLTTRTAIHTTARFHISQVSARRSTLHATVLRLAHGMRPPTQPHRYLSHSSLSASRYHPHFGRHNADGNQMPTQRCHTGCLCLDRPTVQQRKKAGQLTHFTDWLLY